ncbi:MAG TPA: RhtB family transporter [Acidimicrobiaceae bacterium]|nr:RhtB family transporter [Acidimicrobiaceae bacterium]
MYESTTLFAFAVASLVLVLLPGPNSLFILGAGISGGRRHALAAAVGVELGTMAHVLAAALGLSALLQSSAVAFSTIKYLGVAYLVYLGVRALRSKPDEPGEAPHGQRSALASMRNGTLVNVLNPKVSLFFLAFLPQFIDPDRAATPQILLLGTVFFAIALTMDLFYAIASGAVGRWLARRPTLLRQQQRAAGVIYLALAALAATQGSRMSNST